MEYIDLRDRIIEGLRGNEDGVISDLAQRDKSGPFRFAVVIGNFGPFRLVVESGNFYTSRDRYISKEGSMKIMDLRSM